MSTDYLKPTGRFGRILAFIGSLTASVVCWFFVAVAIFGFRRPGATLADHKTAYFIIVFFGFLGCVTAAIVYRLCRGSVSRNGFTLMPIWFIQAFGFFFLFAMLFVGLIYGEWFTALKGAPVAIAMIFIGREISKRKLRSRTN
jgi:hypothetical protein